MGQLIFRCPHTEKDFATGFEASYADMKVLPKSATIRLRCKICAAMHEFQLTHARIDEEVNPAQESPP